MGVVRIGLVSGGRWRRNVLRALVSLGGEVFVATSSGADRRDALDRGSWSAVASVDELGSVDGFVVATPTSTHAEVASRLVIRERPVFVEKPLTADVQSARRLVLHGRDGVATLEAAEHAGVRVRRRGSTPTEVDLRPLSGEAPLLAELRVFVGFLEGGPPPRSGAGTGTEIIQAVEHLRELAGLPSRGVP